MTATATTAAIAAGGVVIGGTFRRRTALSPTADGPKQGIVVKPAQGFTM